jgi:hypothetical protein
MGQTAEKVFDINHFMRYFTDISACIEDEKYFQMVISNTWGLSAMNQ